MGITIQGMAMTRTFFINSTDYYLFHRFQENQKNWQPANFLKLCKAISVGYYISNVKNLNLNK